MALLFIYKTLGDLGLKKKPVTVVMAEAVLPGFREDFENSEFHTLIPEKDCQTVGQLISVSDELLNELDKQEDKYARIQAPLENGTMVFTYVMKPQELREEIFDDEDVMPSDKEEFLKTAIKRFKYCCDDTDQIRTEALQDLKYKNGDQWNEAAKRQRERDSRPCQTVNRLASFVNMVTNDGLQNVPAVKVRPVDDSSDPNTAQVIGGLIQHVVSNGDSKTAFDRAYEGAVSCGLGYFRLLTDYSDNKSFDQEVRIEMIDNPMSVYFPVSIIRKADYSDAPFCFIRYKVSKDEFEQKYPDHKDEMTEFCSGGTGDANWIEEKEVYLAEYFTVEEKTETVYLLKNGKVSNVLPEGERALRERPVTRRVVKWFTITQFTILDGKKWIGSTIPVFPVLGQEQNVDGKKSYISLTRALREPQAMLNFWWSAFTEQVASAPKAPYLIDGRQVEGYADYWENSNKKPLAFLPYKGIDAGGTPLPPPQRIQPTEVSPGILQGIQTAEQFMKEVTGIFDAGMGATSNERTGKAILARQKQSAVATYHFVNNFNRAVRSLGKALIEIIPKIYDMPRTIRIIGEDQTDRVIQINQEHTDTSGTNRLYDLTVGEYDIVITIGPSYDTKRMETVDMMMNLFQTNPQLTMICGDILARKLDFDDNNKMSQRIKNFINATTPGVIGDDEQGTPEQQLHSQLQQVTLDLQKYMQKSQMDDQQKQQLMQMVQAMDKQLKDKQDEIHAKVQIADTKAQAEMGKAGLEIQMQREMMQHDATKHLIDTGIKLKSIGDNPGGVDK